jgi:hypothetical protein
MTPSVRRWLVASVAALAFVCTAFVAYADQAKAKQLYDDGEKAYNLGQFDKSIDLFTKAYEEWPEPAFLFNIAQAYRQAGNCKQALFFYKRFLSLKENDTKKPIKPEVKKDVEGRIAELEECVKRDIANQPPDSLDSGGGGSGSTTTGGGSGSSTTTTGGGSGSSTTTGGGSGSSTTTGGGSGSGSGTRVAGDGSGDDGDDGDDNGAGAHASTTVEMPKLVSVRLTAGVGTLGIPTLNAPAQFSMALTGGYPLAVGDKIELDLGAAITFTPVPYLDTTMQHNSASGAWTTILANAGGEYTVAPKIGVRADLGVGVLIFSGLKQNDPFTETGAGSSGALSSFAFRGAVSADYAITPNLVAQVTPFGFMFAAAPAGFKKEISSLTSIEFMAGIGYRM